jgi:hypothetical protein
MPIPAFFGAVTGFTDVLGTPVLTADRALYLVQHPTRMSEDFESWQEVLYVYDDAANFSRHVVTRSISGEYSDYESGDPTLNSFLPGLLALEALQSYTLYVTGAEADTLIGIWALA